MAAISVIIPVYNAQKSIELSVGSLLEQDYKDFEIIISIDDEQDYASVLAHLNIPEHILRFTSTGTTGSGAANAVNCGINIASGRYIARLDADDISHPNRLRKMLPLVQDHGVASCGLMLSDLALNPLGYVGVGTKKNHLSFDYKHVNYSSDSMLICDRTRVNMQLDTSLTLLSDMDFAFHCFEKVPFVAHIPEPLYIYVKHPHALSRSPLELHISCKKVLLERLQGEYYGITANVRNGLIEFMERSIAAEHLYNARLMQSKDILFEDIIAPLLM